MANANDEEFRLLAIELFEDWPGGSAVIKWRPSKSTTITGRQSNTTVNDGDNIDVIVDVTPIIDFSKTNARPMSIPGVAGTVFVKAEQVLDKSGNRFVPNPQTTVTVRGTDYIINQVTMYGAGEENQVYRLDIGYGESQ